MTTNAELPEYDRKMSRIVRWLGHCVVFFGTVAAVLMVINRDDPGMGFIAPVFGWLFVLTTGVFIQQYARQTERLARAEQDQES